jgi:hypothetical protein
MAVRVEGIKRTIERLRYYARTAYEDGAYARPHGMNLGMSTIKRVNTAEENRIIVAYVRTASIIVHDSSQAHLTGRPTCPCTDALPIW